MAESSARTSGTHGGIAALIEQYTGTSDLEGGRQVGSETGQRAGEEEREREGGGIGRVGSYPVPLSMTMAGRAVASMADSSGESLPAHASAAAGVTGRRGIGVRRDGGLARSPPGAA